jgi:hypothetical protein
MAEPDRPEWSLFVSYAHEDRKFVLDLKKPFVPLERKFGCRLVWDDSEIRSGDAWRAKIDEAIAQARIAVLLLSPDFLASDFIQDVELPRLVKGHAAGQLTILPMLVGAVDLEECGLPGIQFVNPPEQPLKKLNPSQRADWCLEVAKRAKALMLQPAAAPADAGTAAAETATAPSTEPPAGPSPPARATNWVADWTAAVPPELALAEIELQLRRLQQHTRTRGFAVFDRNDYYVQFDYYAELDEASVVVEAQSNAYLRGDRRLNRMQMHYLTDVLQFVQPAENENLLMYAPLENDAHIAQLARITWHVLTEVYAGPAEAPLGITAQCR